MNLSRTLARKDVAAARHTDPDARWDGKIGGLDGDRGSLARTGARLAAGNTTLHHLHGAVRALQSIPTPLRRGTVDMEVQMDTGQTVWTTRRRADLIDGHFATVSGTQPLGTATQLSEELLTRLDPERVDRGYRDLEPDTTSRRALTFTRHHGLLRMTVDLDEAAAVVVRAAVDAASRPEPSGEDVDTRSTMQRRHDGLVALVTTGAHHPASQIDPAVAHKATVVLRATLDDTGRLQSGTASADTHGPVSDATLRAATCDADTSVAVLDPPRPAPFPAHPGPARQHRPTPPGRRMRPRLHRPRLRRHGLGLPLPPRRPLGRRRTHQRRQPGVALRPGPQSPARRPPRSQVRRGRAPRNPRMQRDLGSS